MKNNFDGLTGEHSCSGKWKVTDIDQYIKLKDLIPLLQTKTPQDIDHSKIAWKCMDAPHLKIDERFSQCDIEVPGILAEGVINPFNKPYRMIDGSHRMAKMILNTWISKSHFYILTPQEFYSVLRDDHEKIRN